MVSDLDKLREKFERTLLAASKKEEALEKAVEDLPSKTGSVHQDRLNKTSKANTILGK